MTRLRLAALLLLLPFISAQQYNVPFSPQPAADAGGCSTGGSITFWYNIEGTDASPYNLNVCTGNGTTGCAASESDKECSDSDTSGSLGDLNPDGTAPIVGTYSQNVHGNNDWVDWDADAAMWPTADGAVGVYVKGHSTGLADGHDIWQVNSTGGTVRYRLEIADDSGTLKFRVWDHQNSVSIWCDQGGVSNPPATTGTAYYLQFSWDDTADERTVYRDGTQCGQNTDTITMFEATDLRMGHSGGNPGDYYLDQFIVVDDADINIYSDGCHDDTTAAVGACDG